MGSASDLSNAGNHQTSKHHLQPAVLSITLIAELASNGVCIGPVKCRQTSNIKTSLTASSTKHYIHLQTIPEASLHFSSRKGKSRFVVMEIYTKTKTNTASRKTMECNSICVEMGMKTVANHGCNVLVRPSYGRSFPLATNVISQSPCWQIMQVKDVNMQY